jgi:hypothetical protein
MVFPAGSLLALPPHADHATNFVGPSGPESEKMNSGGKDCHQLKKLAPLN